MAPYYPGLPPPHGLASSSIASGGVDVGTTAGATGGTVCVDGAVVDVRALARSVHEARSRLHGESCKRAEVQVRFNFALLCVCMPHDREA
jgi:hypothetical protein